MMKREAVLHIPMSEYAHGIDEEHYVFRIRTAKGDVTECNLFYGDTACRQTPIIFEKEPMTVVASDEYFDYFEVEMKGLYRRIYYYFELISGEESIYYYSDFFREELVDDRSEYYKLPYNRREDIADIPKWVKKAVVYNIFPDSFATGHRYLSGEKKTMDFGRHQTSSLLGGTIKGIKENADYLEDLGINCIYINPIFAAGEYHKYDLLDYKKIDPCFGTNEDFREMVQVMHSHNIKVIIDGVFNHCGWKFPAFEDVVEKGTESPYKDWFYDLKFPVIRPDNPDTIPEYECFAYERLMPKLNTSYPPLKDYLLEVGTYWIKEFDIDGWRLDVASEVDNDFWRSFRKEVKKVKPDCFIIGEVWETAKYWLDGSQFDSTMNYDMRKHCTYFFAKQSIDAFEFEARVTNMLIRYRKNLIYGQLNLLDSHDVSRFYSVCENNTGTWKLTVLFQILFVGVPSIYYGDEQQITGVVEKDYRSGMTWNQDTSIYQFYKRAISLRKSSMVFSEGDFRTISAQRGSRLYGFARNYQSETYRIYLNAGETAVILPEETGTLIWYENGHMQKDCKEGILNNYGFAIFHHQDYN